MTGDHLTEIEAPEALSRPGGELDVTAMTFERMRQTRRDLAPHVVATPVVVIPGDRFGLTDGTECVVKLELLQTANAFKYRGAVHNMLALDAAARMAGVVTVSSGNHGIAVAEAAQRFGVRATVVMSRHGNPYRRREVAARGAQILLAEDATSAFAQAFELSNSRNLSYIHPYDGLTTLLGTASLGLEFADQAGQLDAVLLPIGGGGLAAGVAAALHALDPAVELIGVEPTGAPTLTRALAAGHAIDIVPGDTVADSLAAPKAGAMAFELCRQHLADVVLIADEDTLQAARTIYRAMRQLVEPAAAITTAALLGPLRSRLAGRRVGIILCGSNFDPTSLSLSLGEGAPPEHVGDEG